MQYRDAPLQQRAHCIVKMFDERTANEPAPLSRERIREVIEQVLAAIEEERQRESQVLLAASANAGPSFADPAGAGGCNCS